MPQFFNAAATLVERFAKPRYQDFIRELKQYPPYFGQVKQYAEALRMLNEVVALMETQRGRDLYLSMVLADSCIEFAARAEQFRMTPHGMLKYVAGNNGGWMPQSLHKVLESQAGRESCIAATIRHAFSGKDVA